VLRAGPVGAGARALMAPGLYFVVPGDAARAAGVAERCGCTKEAANVSAAPLADPAA